MSCDNCKAAEDELKVVSCCFCSGDGLGDRVVC